MSATSALERPLSSSRSSLTPAQVTCGCLPSTATVAPAVSTCPPAHLVLPLPPPSPSLAPDGHTSLVFAGTHKLYNPHTSTTFRLWGRPVDLIYGSGRIIGFLSYDTVRVTGNQKPSQGWPWDQPQLTKQMQGQLEGSVLPKVP